MFGADAVVGAKGVSNSIMREWAIEGAESETQQRERMAWLVDSGIQRAVDNGFMGLFMNNYWKTYYEAWNEEDNEGRPYSDFDFSGALSVTGGASMLDSTLRQAFEGFGEGLTALSTAGGVEGWWGGFADAAGSAGTGFLGVNRNMPKNVMDSIASVARITGSAWRGEEPVWAVARATNRAALEHFVAGSRPFINTLVSKRYGQEIANGKPRNKEFEDSLPKSLAGILGLQTRDEKDAYEFHKKLKEFTANNATGSKNYKARMDEDARNYVNGIVKDLSYLATDGAGEAPANLADEILNRHSKVLASELASLHTNDALEYEAAINRALDEAMAKESIEKTVIEKALGITLESPESFKDFSFIKKEFANSPVVKKDPQLLDSYISYINNYIEQAFGDYEE
jgi:hypothetical protein